MTKANVTLRCGSVTDYLAPAVQVTEVVVECGFGDSIPVGDFDDENA